MAQNKLETQIKEKLNSREIQPGEMAWDRLDAMLSVTEEKKTKRFPFFTLKNVGIAASILVFLSVGLFFINQKEEIPNSDQIVIKENKNNKEQKDSVISKQNFTNEIINQQEEQVAQNSKPETRNSQQSKESFNSINQKTNQNPIINKDKQIEYQVSEVIAQRDMPKIVTQDKTESQNKSVSNIDELLASVEKPQRKDTNSKVKVNANILLAQVDDNSELTFKEKVIKKVNKNYKEIRVAIANRNVVEDKNSVQNQYK